MMKSIRHSDRHRQHTVQYSKYSTMQERKSIKSITFKSKNSAPLHARNSPPGAAFTAGVYIFIYDYGSLDNIRVE